MLEFEVCQTKFLGKNVVSIRDSQNLFFNVFNAVALSMPLVVLIVLTAFFASPSKMIKKTVHMYIVIKGPFAVHTLIKTLNEFWPI